MLYIVATPIGNLGDFSYRAIEVLQQCDYILCEDTRHSRILMQRYGISTPLKSFHKFKEAQSEEQILDDLKSDKNIALISDAGTPLISDPGESLVARCREENISVSAIPGACALITALTLSGFSSTPFQFLGFLPKKEQELRRTISLALLYPGTSIAYEAPHRILDTLKEFQKIAPQRHLCIARELTKLHEECLFGNATELLLQFQQHPPRGEIVLLMSPEKESPLFDDMQLKELVEYLQNTFCLHKSEAIKLAAEMTGLTKRHIYSKFFNTEQE